MGKKFSGTKAWKFKIFWQKNFLITIKPTQFVTPQDTTDIILGCLKPGTQQQKTYFISCSFRIFRMTQEGREFPSLKVSRSYVLPQLYLLYIHIHTHTLVYLYLCTYIGIYIHKFIKYMYKKDGRDKLSPVDSKCFRQKNFLPREWVDLTLSDSYQFYFIFKNKT